jgi:hypothetical protein
MHRMMTLAADRSRINEGRAWRGWLWNLLVIAPLLPLARAVWAEEALPPTAAGSFPPAYPWIPLIAAFGVGSIVAAIVGWASARAVAISNHRQNWINGLREDIVAFLKEIDLLHFRLAKMRRGGDTDDLEKQQELRASGLLIRRRIRLRLNMTESPSVKLDAALEALMTIDSAVANQDRVDAVIKASAAVLKHEWAATKYGGLAGPITGGGTMFFRRWLNASGLLLGIVGVVFIFVWGPPQPSLERHDPVYSSSRAHEASAEAEEQRYKCMSRLGLGLILAGFVLQFANEFLRHDGGEESGSAVERVGAP